MIIGSVVILTPFLYMYALVKPWYFYWNSQAKKLMATPTLLDIAPKHMQ